MPGYTRRKSWSSLRLVGYHTFAMSYSSQSVAILAHQLSLCPPLPTVLGPVEFTEFCARWERVDALVRAGVEREFVTRSLAHKTRARPMTPAEQAAYQRESQRALRCTVARLLLGESLREFSCHRRAPPPRPSPTSNRCRR